MPQPILRKLFDLTGKTAIVTGGSVGIGRGIVERLTEAGANVMIADIDEQEGQKLAQGLPGPGKAAFTRADVRNIDDIEKVVQNSVDQFGGVDILVNNAGVFPFSPMQSVTPELWDRVQGINLRGAFFMAQKAAAQMIEQGRGGIIINIASIDAFHPTGSLIPYDSSKGGMVMMTKSMALELGKQNIRVNGIAPGGIATPGASTGSATAFSQMTPEQIQTMVAAFNQRIPLSRQGEPDDIATVALFLASDASRYITGDTIIVDGGYLLS